MIHSPTTGCTSKRKEILLRYLHAQVYCCTVHNSQEKKSSLYIQLEGVGSLLQIPLVTALPEGLSLPPPPGFLAVRDKHTGSGSF